MGHRISGRGTTFRRCGCWAPSASRSIPKRGSGTASGSAAIARRSSIRGGRPRPAAIMISPLPGVTTLLPGSATQAAPRHRRRHRQRAGEIGSAGRRRIHRAHSSLAGDAARDLGRRRALRANLLVEVPAPLPRRRRRPSRRRRQLLVHGPHRRRDERQRPPHLDDRSRERARRPSRVAEAAVCGKLDDMTGQADLRVRLAQGRTGRARPNWPTSCATTSAQKLGKFTRPKYVTFTQELPKTRSGKIMRRLLRDIAEGRTLGDTTTLADSRSSTSSRSARRSRSHKKNSQPIVRRGVLSTAMKRWLRGFAAHERWAFGEAYRRYGRCSIGRYNVLGSADDARDWVRRRDRAPVALARGRTRLPAAACAASSSSASATKRSRV